MRKIIMSAVGASLMLLSVNQIASARDNQDGRKITRQSTIQNDVRARNANAEYRGDAQRFYGGGNADASLVAPAGR